MRGKSRKIAGYHAQRGWFDINVQKVVKKWAAALGDGVVHDTFLEVRRTMESGQGQLTITIRDEAHRRCVCELLTALDKLHYRKNCAGWVIKLSSCLKPGPRRGTVVLLNWEELQRKIQNAGGPRFSIEALKKAAQRLRLTVFGEAAEEVEQSVYRSHNN